MPSRTRSRTRSSSPTRYSWTCKWYRGASLHASAHQLGTPQILETKTETITDEFGKRPKRGYIRPCTHTTDITRRIEYSIAGTFDMNPNDWDMMFCDRGEMALIGGSFGLSDTIVPLTLPSTLAWSDSAFKSFTEQIPSTLSLPNFILELDDLPRMLSNIWALQARGFSSLRSIMGKNSRPGKRAGSVANKDHLEVNFAVAPFIRDLIDITDSISAYKRRIDWLKRTRGKPVPVKRRLVQYASSPWTDWSPWDNSAQGWGGSILSRSRTRTTVTRTKVIGAVLTHNLKGLDDFSRLATGYLDLLGFNKPLSIVWEAIPFSWLVDYFVNISEVLEQFRTAAPFEGDMLLRDSWTTVKTVDKKEAEFEYKFVCYSDPYGYPKTGVRKASGVVREITNYVRKRGHDTSQGLVATSDLTLNQYLNIAALLS